MSCYNRQFKRFIIDFIALYKSLPVLWDTTSKEYTNREAKTAAYARLVNKLREVEPNATRYDVIKKINSLRSGFRKEYRKVMMGKMNAIPYKPKLWYYKLIEFTVRRDGEKKKLPMEKFNYDTNNTDTPAFEATDVGIRNRLTEEIDNVNFVESGHNSVVEHDSYTASVTDEKYSRHCQSQALPIQDEFDVVGSNVAFKLRRMENHQRIIAERIIAETLFRGEMGTLTVDFCSNLYPPFSKIYEEDIKHVPDVSM